MTQFHPINLFSILLLFSPAMALAQLIPACPVQGSIGFMSENGPQVSDMNETRVFVRATGIHNFAIQNIAISGFSIRLDAVSRVREHNTLPPLVASLGILPAGAYSVSVHATAVNVVPNYLCPAVAETLHVARGFTQESVPALNGLAALLLAALTSIMAVAAIGRRRI